MPQLHPRLNEHAIGDPGVLVQEVTLRPPRLAEEPFLIHLSLGARRLEAGLRLPLSPGARGPRLGTHAFVSAAFELTRVPGIHR